MKRFQELNEVGKIWRRRHYVTLPFKWIWYEFISNLEVQPTTLKGDEEVDDVFYPKGVNLWKILEGLCQMKMGWYYTSDEIEDRVKSGLNKRRGKWK